MPVGHIITDDDVIKPLTLPRNLASSNPLFTGSRASISCTLLSSSRGGMYRGGREMEGRDEERGRDDEREREGWMREGGRWSGGMREGGMDERGR